MKTKTPEEFLNEYGCPDIPFDENVTMYYPAILNAMQDYAKEYTLSLLPSDEEIKEARIKNNESEYKGLTNAAYSLGQWDLKQQILNKLK